MSEKRTDNSEANSLPPGTRVAFYVAVDEPCYATVIADIRDPQQWDGLTPELQQVATELTSTYPAEHPGPCYLLFDETDLFHLRVARYVWEVYPETPSA